MRTAFWIGIGILAVMALVLAALVGGWALWGRQIWAVAPSYTSGGDAPPAPDCATARSPRAMPWGMRPRIGSRGSVRDLPCIQDGRPSDAPAASDALALEDAHQAVERYLASRGYTDLEVAEVMEFEANFYAIAREHETGIGAMELLIDKETGTVAPEMGPNMMWNTRYGMHGRGGMMSRSASTNAISEEEAAAIAQRWLDVNRPGVTAEEHADPFYGYYTLHTRQDGEIEGMLSVHGTTGRVWYHTWHGAFIDMLELDEGH